MLRGTGTGLDRSRWGDEGPNARTSSGLGVGIGLCAGATATLATTAACEGGTEPAPAANTSTVKPLPEITLYQYNPCPFCNKVKAFLDYAGLPWRAVEVDPLFKPEMKVTGHKKVPVVGLDGSSYLQDSDAIIDELHALAAAAGPGHPLPFAAAAGTPAAATEAQWRAWVNGRFVHIVTANIYNTWAESTQTFEYLLNHGNFEKVNVYLSTYIGAGAMFALSKLKLNKKHGIEAPREELYTDCDAWVAAVGDHRFLGNDEKPTLADLAIFGVLRAIQEYDTFGDVMANTKIAPWYFRVAEAVGESARIEE